MNTKLKDLILSKSAGAMRPVREIVKIDGEDTECWFRRLSANDTDDFGLSVLNSEGRADVSKMKGQRGKLVHMTLCDADGRKVLSLQEASELANTVLNPLYETAARVNGMGQKGEEDAGNVPTIPAG